MIELLAPAGDLEKLKMALLYGADAVFIGGKSFSLRANASNFEMEDIKEACDFAHNLGKKIYVTTNIIPHEEDLDGLLPYLEGLEKCGVDAIIAASPVIIDTALKQTNLEVHISTQQSIMNINTVNYWKEKGAERVVLARDLTLNEIENITTNTDVEIEVFIHGGMCAGFSGRCSLSNHLTNRDANRGGCAHTCRWFFDLKESGDNLLTETPFSMASKDLNAIHEITELIDMGVSSLKIEGRMKSLHYVATVVNTYRKIIDEYTKTKTIKDYQKYVDMLSYAENRETAPGFFHGLPTKDEQIFFRRSERVIQNFVGLVLDYNEETQMAKIETRNVYYENEVLKVFSPNHEGKDFLNTLMIDKENNKVERAHKAKDFLFVKVPFKVYPNDMIRAIRE